MPTTINSGTILIEGNAFTAERLRFESEPWSRLYMAGEVIRESRKASGKQSPYTSRKGDPRPNSWPAHRPPLRNSC